MFCGAFLKATNKKVFMKGRKPAASLIKPPNPE
jgi:hypothetical protein